MGSHRAAGGAEDGREDPDRKRGTFGAVDGEGVVEGAVVAVLTRRVRDNASCHPERTREDLASRFGARSFAVRSGRQSYGGMRCGAGTANRSRQTFLNSSDAL